MASISKQEFLKALHSLQEAYIFSQKQSLSLIEKSISRDACIQRYEYSIELTWKLMKKIMGSSSATSRPIIREMAQNDYIQNPKKWFVFINARNKTSHAYDEAIAQDVYEVIPDFIKEIETLLPKINEEI